MSSEPKAGSGWRRLLRDPLLHFLAIGAVLFAGIAFVRGLQKPHVRIDAAELEQLATYWEMQMQRPPTRQELASIIHERVDEELLAREALRLGLDKDDMIIRRRLAQKMAFASEDTATIPEPSDATLEAFYKKTAEQYATPERVALRHIYFSRDRGGMPPESAAEEALKTIRGGGVPAGDPFLLPLTYADITVADISRDYGPKFLQAALKAPIGVWVGPVESPYGMHLVRVERRLATQTPPLDQVKDEVKAAWLADQRERNRRAYLASLRKRYQVEVEGLPTQ